LYHYQKKKYFFVCASVNDQTLDQIKYGTHASITCVGSFYKIYI